MKKAQKTMAFYVEALLLTLFLLMSMGILIRMFSTARAIGQTARHETVAALIAQNVGAEFGAARGAFEAASAAVPQEFALRYEPDGTPSDSGPYLVAVVLQPEPTAAGVMLNAHFTITYQADARPILELDTARYCPAQAAR